MKNMLRLEEACMFILCIYALKILNVEWWVYILMLIAPDVGCIGYVGGNRVGAVCYNLFHHKGIAIAIFVAGLALKNEWLQIAGLILFGHSSMDRMMGYGLKLNQGFKYTHLGPIGQRSQS